MKTGPNRVIKTFLAMVVALSATVVNAQVERVPLPSSEQQQASEKRLNEAYGVSKAGTASEKQKLVKRLMQEAVADPKLPKDDLYAVLTTVIGLSQSLRDLPVMNDAIERLVTTFNVDSSAERTRHLVRYLESANVKTVAALKPIVDNVASMVHSAAAEHRFRDAEKLLDEIDAVLMAEKVPGSVKQPLTELRKEITAKSDKFEAFQLARSVLESKPDDPDANFTVSRWLVTAEQSWTLALPHLAKSSNSKPWQAAAALELTPGADAEKIGNAWWEIAEAESEPEKRELLLHAGEWYQQALPKLTTLSKKLIEKRLSEIAALPKVEVKAASSGKTQSGASNSSSSINDEGKLPTEKWIDLLAMVKLPDHVLRGKWRQEAGAMICEPSNDARFQIPVALRGSYELNCEFTRRAGGENIAVVIPVGAVSCAVVLSGWNGAASGLHLIDGRESKDVPAVARAGVRPSKLQNGHRYRLEIEVAQSNDVASVTAALDGKRFVQWKGRVAQLSCPWYNRIPALHAVGVNVHQSPTDIHKLELRIKQGSKGFRMGDDWQDPIEPVASAPPKAIADKCLAWNDRKYFISDKPMNLTEAQRLASLMDGRLLTISSAAEEAFILNAGRGLFFWMSGWRRTDSNDWRDERNRPLRYKGNWGFHQPNNRGDECYLGIVTATNRDRGWHDLLPPDALHVIIEWGEEYPNGK